MLKTQHLDPQRPRIHQRSREDQPLPQQDLSTRERNQKGVGDVVGGGHVSRECPTQGKLELEGTKWVEGPSDASADPRAQKQNKK